MRIGASPEAPVHFFSAFPVLDRLRVSTSYGERRLRRRFHGPDLTPQLEVLQAGDQNRDRINPFVANRAGGE